MKEPFEGLKVADFSWTVTGPLVSKYLADFGATVVRIESSLHPDSPRLSAPYTNRKPGLNRSGFFTLYNNNKYDIALNLNCPQGPDVAKRIIMWSDVVLESFAPGVMEKHGLSYEDLKIMKPDIVMFRTSTQGQTGPYAKHPGFGYQAAGFIGFPLLIGWPDRSPMPIPIAYTDFIAFQFGAAALIAALDNKRRTGKGQYLDMSQIEAALHFLSPVMLDWIVNSREPARSGNSSPDSAPHGVFRCKGDDDWCAIAVTNDRQWTAFTETIDKPQWSIEPEFCTFIERKRNEDKLNKLIEEWTILFDSYEVMNKLQSAGVPCSVVANGEILVNDPHLKERGYYWELEHQEMGTVLTPGQPFKMSKTPARAKMAAPCLGEHTEFVCRELLKMDDEEFVELLTCGCFE
jgi:crotonobetainyl-CoA:carnitine CoA-transferase CaiB-like acyl-CoA transferase